MAKPKRWPKVANEARLESIHQAAEIQITLSRAQQLVRRNPEMAMVLISEAIAKALVIQVKLETAHAGDEEENNGNGADDDE